MPVYAALFGVKKPARRDCRPTGCEEKREAAGPASSGRKNRKACISVGVDGSKWKLERCSSDRGEGSGSRICGVDIAKKERAIGLARVPFFSSGRRELKPAVYGVLFFAKTQNHRPLRTLDAQDARRRGPVFPEVQAGEGPERSVLRPSYKAICRRTAIQVIEDCHFDVWMYAFRFMRIVTGAKKGH